MGMIYGARMGMINDHMGMGAYGCMGVFNWVDLGYQIMSIHATGRVEHRVALILIHIHVCNETGTTWVQASMIL